MKKRKGFTLVEVMVVIAIILVLMGLLAPAIKAVIDASNGVENPRYEQVLQTPFDDGRESYSLGIDPDANPYQGMQNYARESKEWLNGWQHEKTKGGAKEDTKQQGPSRLRLRED